MIKSLNIIRYVIAIIAPLLMMLWHPTVATITTLILLYLNNVLDDILFYYGSLFVSTKGYRGGIASPVNGIVTKVQNGVRLFSHLDKKDCLTKYDFFDEIRLSPHTDGKAWMARKYNHVTVFLNKLNHHIVCNIGERVEHMQHLSLAGEPVDMVLDGHLTASNEGEYLTNPFIVFQYRSCFVVLTLDRYISKFVPYNSKPFGFEGFICRGSQCDIYTQGDILVKEGQAINVFDTIATSDLKVLSPTTESPLPLIQKCLPLGVKQIWKENANKTISTFFNPIMLAAFSLGVSYGIVGTNVIYALSYISASIFYLFLFVRSYKHLMYALMNVTGNKNIYHKSYKAISKISLLWQPVKKKNSR